MIYRVLASALLSVVLVGSNIVSAQSTNCTISVSPMTATICIGDSVNITSLGNLLGAGQMFDFNTGNIPSGWGSTGGTAYSTPCGQNPTNTPYFWASTVSSGNPSISTAAFDVTCGGNIVFDMMFATQGGSTPCEGPDEADEGVSLQYSTDGGITWTTITYFSPGGYQLPANPFTSGGVLPPGNVTPYTSWNTYTIPIPPGAITTNTMFQWVQESPTSGSCCDNWGLDNIIINASGGACGTTTFVNWSNGLMNTQDFWITPIGDTTLVAYVYDSLGVLHCQSDTIFLNVEFPPTPDAGQDFNVCLGSPIALDGTLTSSLNSSNWTSNTSNVTPAPSVLFSPNNVAIDPLVYVNQMGLYYFILNEDSPYCGISSDTVAVQVSDLSVAATFVEPSCGGTSDGEIQITSVGAIEYSIDNGTTWSPSATFAGIAAGNYTVCARTALGCEKCVNIVVTDPDPVVITVSNDTLICQNGTAYLSASATGGNSYEFLWSHTPNTGAQQSVDPLVATSYTVIAENENGCQSAPATIDVTIRPPLSGDITPWDTICPGYPTTITASTYGGIGAPYTFTWSSGELHNGNGMHTITANPPATQDYIVTITDECETTPLVLQTNIYVAPLPVPDYFVVDPIQCEPAEFTIINTTDPALSEYVYWLIDGEQEFLNQDTILTDSLWAGYYDIQMIVTTDLGCVDSLTFEDALHVKPKPIADFKYSPSPVLMFNTDVFFQNYSINGYTYQWFFPGADPSNSTLTDVMVQYPDGVTGTYDVVLITTSELGCVDTAYQQVVVMPEVVIYAPNAFTPDGDEFNQSWRVFMEGVDFQDFELMIYNRWGQVVWESHDIDVAWDGTFNGKFVPAGTYSWVIKTKDALNDAKYTYTGHVTILK